MKMESRMRNGGWSEDSSLKPNALRFHMVAPTVLK